MNDEAPVRNDTARSRRAATIGLTLRSGGAAGAAAESGGTSGGVALVGLPRLRCDIAVSLLRSPTTAAVLAAAIENAITIVAMTKLMMPAVAMVPKSPSD